jgi:AcrR family transcriptional regulator
MSSPEPATKAEAVTAFRRAQILSAARERFTRQGVTNTTVNDIAKAAKVAKGTVYLYYRTKDDLLRQLLDDDLDALRSATLPVIAEPGALHRRLCRFFEITLEFFDRHREFIEHCQLEMKPEVRKKVRTTLGRCYQDQVDAWTRSLALDAARGEVASSTADGVSWQIVALARGMAQQRLAGWTSESPLDAATRAAELLSKGLATR